MKAAVSEKREVIRPSRRPTLRAATLSFMRFEHVLRKYRLIDPAALDDPEGFDNYRTHGAIHAAHRELTSDE